MPQNIYNCIYAWIGINTQVWLPVPEVNNNNNNNNNNYYYYYYCYDNLYGTVTWSYRYSCLQHMCVLIISNVLFNRVHNVYIFRLILDIILRIFCILPAITASAITLPDHRAVYNARCGRLQQGGGRKTGMILY